MRVIAYLLATALLFSGCAEDKPKEPGPTSTPSPTATVPVMPPAAQANTKAGAIAFVKHYIDVFNYASNTGDVEELQKLSDPACEGCTEYINLYKKTYSDGGYFKNAEWVMSAPEFEKQSSDLVVFAHVDAPAGTYRLTNDDVEKPGDPEDVNLAFVPKYSTTGWQLYEFGRQKDAK